MMSCISVLNFLHKTSEYLCNITIDIAQIPKSCDFYFLHLSVVRLRIYHLLKRDRLGAWLLLFIGTSSFTDTFPSEPSGGVEPLTLG